jgi:extracellular elastinolytic metalloproteinase
VDSDQRTQSLDLVAIRKLLTSLQPFRDSAFSNDIIAHEYTHGISSRLVNGGRGIQCCKGNDGEFIAEALGDSFADWLSQESAPIQDFGYGGWVLFIAS